MVFLRRSTTDVRWSYGWRIWNNVGSSSIWHHPRDYCQNYPGHFNGLCYFSHFWMKQIFSYDYMSSLVLHSCTCFLWSARFNIRFRDILSFMLENDTFWILVLMAIALPHLIFFFFWVGGLIWLCSPITNTPQKEEKFYFFLVDELLWMLFLFVALGTRAVVGVW